MVFEDRDGSFFIVDRDGTGEVSTFQWYTNVSDQYKDNVESPLGVDESYFLFSPKRYVKLKKWDAAGGRPSLSAVS